MQNHPSHGGGEDGREISQSLLLRYKNKRLLWYQNRRQSFTFLAGDTPRKHQRQCPEQTVVNLCPVFTGWADEGEEAEPRAAQKRFDQPASAAREITGAFCGGVQGEEP